MKSNDKMLSANLTNLTNYGNILPMTIVIFFTLTAFVLSSTTLYFIQSVFAAEQINNQNLSGDINLRSYQNDDHQLKMKYPENWEKIENHARPENVITFVLKSKKSNDTGVAIALYDIALPYANISTDYTNLQNNSLAKNFNILISNASKLAGCTSHEIIYASGTQDIKAMQAWTVKQAMGEDHVYLIVYISDASKFSHYLPLARSVIQSLEAPYNVQSDSKCS